jgi:aerobic-type carbon monoxide dehydrogenase small subunit (CoxS/CutS family)
MKLVVNGAEVEVAERHAKTPLLWVLRDVLGLHGTKFGCGAGFCAACTVLIDGRNMKSCQTATERTVGKSVTTVEGASGPVVDAVRDAWHRGNVVQCGYCQPGQTLAAVSLLTSKPAPDDAAIDTWMSGNLCRCGTYPRIRAAIHDAARMVAAGDDPAPLVAAPELEMSRLTPEEVGDPVLPYVRFQEDGTVVAYSSQIEMGQGIHTGLATIVAEELDADFDSVRVVNAANGGGPPRDVYGSRPRRRSCGVWTPTRSSSSEAWCATPAGGPRRSLSSPRGRSGCRFPTVSSPSICPTTRWSGARAGCASILCRRSSEPPASRST